MATKFSNDAMALLGLNSMGASYSGMRSCGGVGGADVLVMGVGVVSSES